MKIYCIFGLSVIVAVEGFTSSPTTTTRGPVLSSAVVAAKGRGEYISPIALTASANNIGDGASDALELELEQGFSSSCMMISRQKFMNVAKATATSAAVSALLSPSQASARGRATLEAAYDRYYPRLLAGGEFYAADLKKAIERNDWAAIKAATQEPPPRSKADKSKIDGGVSERAAQAGGFSRSRVITAAELWAASFSDSSISPKTKAMKEQTVILGEVVDGMNTAAKIALGEEKPSGGILGFGKKAPTQTELAKEVRELYIKGGNTWNQYIYLANDDLPIQLKRLPYL